ncbi:hypothetical protein [Microbacterium sp. 77mftsu3.1]|uniref:hypothetical protein n=1 Tax=Microbacterium sp. 77mftsu3.1 TaxID=1761802 RepID=UPI0003759655|nr:hypothetical protein [Microbacterium sp. 77mftsu3.1]SDG21821.1 hypothetical protein SAMN04488590_0217 [Microbacterium sp. 77mftsu3.1]
MKSNAFGQITGTGFAPTFHRPFLRYFAPVDDAAGGGGDGAGGDGANGGDGGDTGFKPPASQEEFERLVAARVARADRSARADERRKLEESKSNPKPGDAPKPGDEKAGDHASGVSEEDVDKRIQDALAAKDRELAIERIADQLDKALEGRKYTASKLLTLDRSQFVAEDGKSVDTVKLQSWVDENSEEGAAPNRRLPGQGERGDADGGLESGKSAYEKRHPKKN